jgi:glycosyltransferase involved in cell wall biosynthesis
LVSVLHVLEAVRGGTSRHVVDVIQHAGGVRHEVALPPARLQASSSGAQYDQAAVEAMRAAGAEIHEIPMRRAPIHPANLSAVVALRRLLKQRNPDVVHGHSSIGGALARVACWSSSVPCVYTPNGLVTDRSGLLVERALGRRTTRFVAVSPSEGDRAAGLGLVERQRIEVIPNGIDLRSPDGTRPDLRERLGLEPDTPLVGTIARLVPQKAPEDYVRAAAIIARRRPGVHFVLIGMGPLQDAVDLEIRRGGLAGRFHQIKHLENAATVIDQFQVFALPSRFEGGPYTPLEAMRAGTPVVLSDAVGNRDAVVDGASGFLHSIGDFDALATAVIRLLDDDELRAAVAAAARERVQSEFDVRIMGRKLADLYRSLGGASRRSTRRLPQPASGTSSNSPDSTASQYNS